MLTWFSRILDKFSEFLANRKGLLPIIGIILILMNFILRLVAPGWLADNDFLLHVGIIIALVGFLLAFAL